MSGTRSRRARSPLVLPPAARAAIAGWVEAGFPHEVCGLLVGRETARGVEVDHAAWARNVAVERRRDRYALAPEDFARIEHDARGRGLEVLGVWHSHPRGPARPSVADREGAWRGWSYLIAAVFGDGLGEVRAWRLDGEGFIEQAVVEPGPAGARTRRAWRGARPRRRGRP